MAESVAQRPAMAMLFRNLARANPQVMERYVHRLIASTRDPATCQPIAQAQPAQPRPRLRPAAQGAAPERFDPTPSGGSKTVKMFQ
jgi:hypothetical protein